jgi:hypothetical protein
MSWDPNSQMALILVTFNIKITFIDVWYPDFVGSDCAIKVTGNDIWYPDFVDSDCLVEADFRYWGGKLHITDARTLK